MDTAKSILQLEENNLFAAMLIGIVMAESRKFKEAKDLFNLLVENAPNYTNVLLNLAHLEFLNVIQFV